MIAYVTEGADRLHIRRASMADAIALAELRWNWVTAATTDEATETDHAQFVRTFTRWMADRQATHQAFLAQEQHTVLGMAWLVLSERVPEPGALPRPTGDLQSVFVVPDFRAQGIGRRLIEAVIDTASALGLEYLSVRAGTRSRPLYQRLGFTTNDRVLELGPPDPGPPRTA